MSSNPLPDWDPTAPEILKDQRAAFDQMRQTCPVAYSNFQGWTLFRHADVLRVLHDPKTFSNAVSRHLSVPNGMDVPEHTEYRKIIESFFTPEYMAIFEPKCRKVIDQLLHDLPHDGVFDIQEKWARPYAVQVQCAFLNWSDFWHKPLIHWTKKNHEATLVRDRNAMSEIAREFEGFIDTLLDEHVPSMTNSLPDVITGLTQSRVWGRHLYYEEISSILRNWTVGEIGTIAASIGILIDFLAHYPDWQATWRDHPEQIPEAIEEILRLHGPLVTNRRLTTKPVEIGGKHIGANERITINWVSANRDEEVFEEPDQFRFGRNPSDNLLWGAGVHVCPGAPLARMELRLFLEELLARTNSIELDPHKASTPAKYPASGFASLPVRIHLR